MGEQGAGVLGKGESSWIVTGFELQTSDWETWFKEFTIPSNATFGANTAHGVNNAQVRANLLQTPMGS